jgi:hypothetical protein
MRGDEQGIKTKKRGKRSRKFYKVNSGPIPMHWNIFSSPSKASQ